MSRPDHQPPVALRHQAPLALRGGVVIRLAETGTLAKKSAETEFPLREIQQAGENGADCQHHQRKNHQSGFMIVMMFAMPAMPAPAD